MKSVFRVLASATTVALAVIVSASFSAQSLEPQQTQKWLKRGYCDRITFANRAFCRSAQASLPPAPAAAPLPADTAPVVTGSLSQPPAPQLAPTKPLSPLARIVNARNERFVKRGFCDHISDANRAFCKQMGITGEPPVAPAQTAAVIPPTPAGAPTATGSLSSPPTTTGPAAAAPVVDAAITEDEDTATATTCVPSAWAQAGFCRRITAFNRRFCEDVCGPPTVTGAIGAPRVTGAIGGGGNPFGPGGTGTPPGAGDDDNSTIGPVASNPPTGDDDATSDDDEDEDENNGGNPGTGGDDDDDGDDTGTGNQCQGASCDPLPDQSNACQNGNNPHC